MDENTKKIIKERFDALPESIQEVILSSHYQENLIEIGKKYQLNIEQMGILERETTLVLLGLSPTQSFEVELTRELDIDKIKGNQLVKEINEKIFLTIRDLLKLMYTPEGEEPSVDEEEPEESTVSEIPLDTKVENPKPTPSILFQKLSGSFQKGIVTTDHSMENITKDTINNSETIKKLEVDPYREIPG